ncbi:hypothetical protein diail_5833, partial [Diaporthe ilicicola]
MEAVCAAKTSLRGSISIVLDSASVPEFDPSTLTEAHPHSSFKEDTPERPHVDQGTDGEIDFLIPMKFRWAWSTSITIQKRNLEIGILR